MESKNLIIACVWTFVTVIVGGYLLAGILWTDYDLAYDMMGNVFNVGLLLFFIASIFTVAVPHLIPENMKPELVDELQSIRLRLDELSRIDQEDDRTARKQVK